MRLRRLSKVHNSWRGDSNTPGNIHNTSVLSSVEILLIFSKFQKFYFFLFPQNLPRSLRLSFWWGSVNADNNCVVPLVGLQRDLFLWLHLLRDHLLHLAGEHGLGLRRGVDAIGLDGDDEVAAILEIVLSVVRHDTSLVGLSHVSENAVNHGHQHTVLVRVSG